MVDNDFSSRIAHKAFEEAKAFFQPPSEWELSFYSFEDAPEWLQDEYPDDAQACCHISHQSLKVRILYNPERIDDGAELWLSIAHEVAHLLMLETLRLADSLKGLYAEDANNGIEVMTIRLERLFARERPYPGDEAFFSEAGNNLRNVMLSTKRKKSQHDYPSSHKQASAHLTQHA